MSHPLYQRNCRLCDTPLGFLRTPEGKTIAIDLAVPIYTPGKGTDAIKNELSYADHMATCKKLDGIKESKPISDGRPLGRLE